MALRNTICICLMWSIYDKWILVTPILFVQKTPKKKTWELMHQIVKVEENGSCTTKTCEMGYLVHFSISLLTWSICFASITLDMPIFHQPHLNKSTTVHNLYARSNFAIIISSSKLVLLRAKNLAGIILSVGNKIDSTLE